VYLALDGILGAVSLFGIIVAAYYCKEEPNDNCCLYILGKIAIIFGIIWTILGAVTFWKLIDNRKCDRPVYNYVFAQLVIKIICYFVKIIINNN
jgi:hypothetical protein